MIQTSALGDLRQLSHEQIWKALDEWRYYLAWEEVCHFALSLYGKRAYKVVFDYQNEYNDEGGTYCYIHDIHVYDFSGQALQYDFTAPHWHDPEAPFYPPLVAGVNTETPLQAIDAFLCSTLGEQRFCALSVDELQARRCEAVDEHYMLDTYTCLRRLQAFISSTYNPAYIFELEKPPMLAFSELYGFFSA
ncbi:MAG TPA: hypothetical protein VF458_03500 [Ktedonobacteraceae bacterium]